MTEEENKTPGKNVDPDSSGQADRPGAAYCDQVRDWLNTVYQTNMLQLRLYATFSQQFDWSSLQSSSPGLNLTSPGLVINNFNQSINSNNSNSNLTNNNIPNISLNNTATRSNRPTTVPPPQPPVVDLPQQPPTNVNNNNLPNISILNNRIYTLAPLWKRIVAEMIDFIILLILKIVVALNAAEMFELDLENYELLLESLNPDSMDVASMMDYNAAVQFSSDLLLIELMHRVIVCLYEAMCTCRGPAGNQGGATPGKFIMGLRVIRCSQLIPTGGNRVLVNPGGNLGFGWALLRSLLKNLSVATMFPLCISLTLDPNTRTVHDFLANSVVVERR